MEGAQHEAKVRKSNTLLIGPKKSMKRRTKAMSQRDGVCSCSRSTRSVGRRVCGATLI